MIDKILNWFNEQEIALQFFLILIISTILAYSGLAFVSLIAWIVNNG